jgi:curli biogenesis system outer membrane secretion channel CsgG
VSIPYQPDAPRFVVAVLPFETAASGIVSGGATPSAPAANSSILSVLQGGLKQEPSQSTSYAQGALPSVGPGLAAQLTTALGQSGNISLLDPSALVKGADGSYSCKLALGEVGPYIVRGAVTEFNETADLSEQKRGGSLAPLGAALGVAGLASGSNGLAWTGAGLAVANPTYENREATRTGMVGIDVRVVDGRNGRIVSAFNSSGSFTTQSATSGLSVFGIGGGNAEFAASALGQATRVAMNDSVTRISGDLLSRAPR